MLALELRRRGRSCALLERLPKPSAHSKALAIMPRTFALFERAGVAQEFARASNAVRRIEFVAWRARCSVDLRGEETPFPALAIVPQWRTQAILETRLRELGGEVRYGCALESFEQDADGVCVRIATSDGHAALNASYLAACDGVHSSIRSASRIAFEGGRYAHGALLADVRFRDPIERDVARVHVMRQGMVTCFPLDARGARIVVVSPGEHLPERADRAWLEERLASAGYEQTRLGAEPVWSGIFHVESRVARAMRHARVVLAGDAAHAHSPVGGQGMNTGLYDAAALAAAFAEALDGDQGALARYEAQRLPAARRVVRTVDFLTRALLDPHPLARFARSALAPAAARLHPLHRRIWRSLAC